MPAHLDGTIRRRAAVATDRAFIEAVLSGGDGTVFAMMSYRWMVWAQA
jgi:hypothetical protein